MPVSSENIRLDHAKGAMMTTASRRFLLIGMDGMNLLLLRRFEAEGYLPNFSRLMSRGSTNRLLPALPAWTPNNWATMVTGTTPGSHRLGGWTVRQKTDPWDAERLHAWDSRAISDTETIWDVADQAGLRTLVQFFPSAVWPSRLKHGYVVAPGYHDAPYSIAMPMTYYATSHADAKFGTEQVGVVAQERTTDLAEEGPPPGTSVVRLAMADGWNNAPRNALSAVLPILLKTGEADQVHLLAVQNRKQHRYDHIGIYAKPDMATKMVDLNLGTWSPFWQGPLGKDRVEVAMRFRVLGADPDDGTLYICRTEAYATRGIAWPEGLDRRLVDACGPFYSWPSVIATLGQPELETFVDDMRYQGEWQVKVARHIRDHGGWDLHFSHWHLFDDINHPTINDADPDGPNYDPERGAWMLECQRRTYQVGDSVLGQFLELADRDTTVCVISDHGMAPAHRWADVPTLLRDKGLLVYQADGQTIDWARSVAYIQADRGSEVYVNLKGREPMGIVPPDDYEKVQEAIIDTLLDWRDPGISKRPVALALKLQDAQIIGFWGAENGDVVMTFNRGYGWGPPVGGGSVGAGREALHGSQIPTSETPFATNMACCVLSGPGIRVGYERDWQRWGLMRMVDVAPTIAHILGLRPPRQSTGAVLTDLLDR
jgi:predicted AlkP superfamily phosphohydrolase/phosphomutase